MKLLNCCQLPVLKEGQNQGLAADNYDSIFYAREGQKMRVPIVIAVVILTMSLLFSGMSCGNRSPTADTAHGNIPVRNRLAAAHSISVSTVSSAEDCGIQFYEVRKKVTDFPDREDLSARSRPDRPAAMSVTELRDREDLSTPEAAYASIHRAIAREGFSALDRLSVPRIAGLASGTKPPVLSKEKRESLLTAEILEVHLWEETHAVVIARVTHPGKPGHIDLRILERVKGCWLNEGNDLADTVEQARQKVERVQYIGRVLLAQ